MIVQQQSIGGFIIKYTENSAFVMHVGKVFEAQIKEIHRRKTPSMKTRDLPL